MYRDALIILPERNDPVLGWTVSPDVPSTGSFAEISRYQSPNGRWLFFGRLRMPSDKTFPTPASGGVFENEWGVDEEGLPKIVNSMFRRFKEAHPILWVRYMNTFTVTNPDGTTSTVGPSIVSFLGSAPEPKDW